MKVFVGIPIYEPVEGLMRVLFSDSGYRETMRRPHTETHITLKPPQFVEDVEGWMQAAQKACQNFTAQTLTVNHSSYFGNGKYLALDIEPSPLDDLVQKLEKALHDYDPKGMTYWPFRPHVSVGRALRPLDPSEKAQLLSLVDKKISHSIEFKVETVRLYGQTDGQKYVSLADIKLSDN